ncbi:MAG: hypothetical protein ACLRR6_11945 [Oscillospiraceae bacterium]
MTQENGCGRGNEALCRSVFIIFVSRKEDWIMKRMIAAILVLCMVLCSIPVAAAASFDEFFCGRSGDRGKRRLLSLCGERRRDLPDIRQQGCGGERLPPSS